MIKTLGLALGGGGARGLAHIGVLKVLEAEGIPVHLLAGASMGGIIAALYASGRPAGELEDIAHRLTRLRELMKLVDINPPRRGLLEGRRVRDYLAGLLGEALTFRDLTLPLSLTAVDLVSACEVALREGLLLPAVLATSAFPGLLPPQELGGMMLVDGGVLNNVPADHARQMGAEVVVAVDVQHNPCEELPWQLTRSRPLLLATMPELFADFYRSELIMIHALTRARLDQAHPDFLLRPRISPDISMFLGFTRAEELIHTGEDCCREWLPQIEKALGQSKNDFD